MASLEIDALRMVDPADRDPMGQMECDHPVARHKVDRVVRAVVVQERAVDKPAVLVSKWFVSPSPFVKRLR